MFSLLPTRPKMTNKCSCFKMELLFHWPVLFWWRKPYVLPSISFEKYFPSFAKQLHTMQISVHVLRWILFCTNLCSFFHVGLYIDILFSFCFIFFFSHFPLQWVTDVPYFSCGFLLLSPQVQKILLKGYSSHPQPLAGQDRRGGRRRRRRHRRRNWSLHRWTKCPWSPLRYIVAVTRTSLSSCSKVSKKGISTLLAHGSNIEEEKNDQLVRKDKVDKYFMYRTRCWKAKTMGR